MGFVLLDGYDRYRTYLTTPLYSFALDKSACPFRGLFHSSRRDYTRTIMSPEDRERPQLTHALCGSYSRPCPARAKLRPMLLTNTSLRLRRACPRGGRRPAGRAGRRVSSLLPGNNRASRSSGGSSSSSADDSSGSLQFRAGGRLHTYGGARVAPIRMLQADCNPRVV